MNSEAMIRSPRRRSRRDPSSVAEDMERFAERVNTKDAWLVAADAWEDASQPERARFAYLRQWNPSVLSNAEAKAILRRYSAYYETSTLSAAREQPTNEETGLLEIYRFFREPPTHLFAYYNNVVVGGKIHTFRSGLLGTITHVGGQTHAFGGNTRLRHVTVRAVNGYIYSGTCTCSLDTGGARPQLTYCKLKRGKSWLKR